MSKNKYSYFKRAEEENRPGLSLTDRDIDIVESIATYRFLTTKMISAIYPNSSKRSLQRRLKKMYHHGIVGRPRSQLGLRLFSNQREIIYSLGQEGVNLLVRERDWNRSRLDYQTKEIRSAYLAHGLMVSRFRICLELASKKPKEVAEEEYDRRLRKHKFANGDLPEVDKRAKFKEFYETEREKLNRLKEKGLNPVYEVVRWESGKIIQDHVLIGTRGNKEKFPVVPDGFFHLRFPSKRKGNKDTYFFFEADRNTMSQDRFLKKLKAYWWLSRREAKEGLKQRLGMKDFRVVTVTTNKRRVENLVEVSKQADPKERGSSMFLFTEESNFSLEEPKSVLERIFITPVSKEKQSILE
ncbi:replication-relaxation family protein [Candidatus Bipolaricaulota bacterium]|nr:replication-relaxation family protein [Candidatus Bipolaricaulota bacterium]